MNIRYQETPVLRMLSKMGFNQCRGKFLLGFALLFCEYISTIPLVASYSPYSNTVQILI